MSLRNCAITTSAAEAHIGGSGPVIEHAVKMRQFAPADELDQLLEADTVTVAELECFGRALARIHDRLPMALPAQGWGEPEALDALVLRNLEESAAAGEVLGAAPDLRALESPLAE